MICRERYKGAIVLIVQVTELEGVKEKHAEASNTLNVLREEIQMHREQASIKSIIMSVHTLLLPRKPEQLNDVWQYIDCQLVIPHVSVFNVCRVLMHRPKQITVIANCE